MTLFRFTLRSLILVALTISLIACNKNSTQKSDLQFDANLEKLVNANETSDNSPAPDTENNPLEAIVGASEIPYPMYPNGTKYRVGGENGLKIVVFQTEDSFNKVDDYYNSLTDNASMARIAAMSDYVRYSREADDLDPWATHKPGIVIHEFDDQNSRQAVGASAVAKTNIIMSF